MAQKSRRAYIVARPASEEPVEKVQTKAKAEAASPGKKKFDRLDSLKIGVPELLEEREQREFEERSLLRTRRTKQQPKDEQERTPPTSSLPILLGATCEASSAGSAIAPAVPSVVVLDGTQEEVRSLLGPSRATRTAASKPLGGGDSFDFKALAQMLAQELSVKSGGEAEEAADRGAKKSKAAASRKKAAPKETERQKIVRWATAQHAAMVESFAIDPSVLMRKKLLEDSPPRYMSQAENARAHWLEAIGAGPSAASSPGKKRDMQAAEGEPAQDSTPSPKKRRLSVKTPPPLSSCAPAAVADVGAKKTGDAAPPGSDDMVSNTLLIE
eukprot:TRINITY_DN6275_c0_g1_i1.p1 TRINITY_DN6275_c0_g1~~TRINITY_DN6275_c0_g1_i1.p1  ORF type:complete len:328 (-),score=101.71 TRINITY_DN6275_c0_g1_i1:170-1153(-)